MEAKKSKSVPDGGTTPTCRKTFVLHYIVKDSETKKSHCQSVFIETKEDSADDWIMQIEDRRKEGKPQRLLVVINPIGGKGNARQVLRKRIQPLFALAGVELIIKEF
nr:hypothetical protein BaRGS_030784 [Batillaria attramentaria]